MNRFITRSLILVTTFGLLLGTLPLASAQEKRTLKSIYADGVKLFEAEQYEAALEEFETFLKHQPNYPYARSYAAKCRQKIKEGVTTKRDLEAELAKITIPSIKFEETSLAMVFEFLRQKSEELSNGKSVANFIYKGSDEQKKATKVTLTLRNAPFTEVVRYVGQITRTQFSYEEFAVVATPAGSGGTTSTTSPTTAPVPLEAKFDSNNGLKSIPPANNDPFNAKR